MYLRLLILIILLFAPVGATAQSDTVRNPVIIVPGLLESWPINDVWQFEPLIGMYDDFRRGLESVGYVKDHDYFLFPYDWHRSNKVTAGLLSQKITEIRALTGSEKVDIVAHSMGGLVARAYIQSDNYNNDIDQFITIATPHYGSVNAYFTWMYGEVGSTPFEFIEEQFLRYESITHGYGLSVIDYIHDHFLSLGELLPIFNYLLLDNFLLAYSSCGVAYYPCNNFLSELNTSLQRLNAVSMTTIMADDRKMKTLHAIILRSRNDWGSGIISRPSMRDDVVFGFGDGLVLTHTARLDLAAQITVEVDHVKSVSEATPTVVRLLSGSNIPTYQWSPPHRYLFLALFSPASFIYTDAAGRRTGYDPTTKQGYDEVPGAFFSGPTEHPYLFIRDYSAEQSTIQVVGTDTGSYTLESSTSDTETTTTHQGTIHKDEIHILDHQPSSNTLALTEIIPPPAPSAPTLDITIRTSVRARAITSPSTAPSPSTPTSPTVLGVRSAGEEQPTSSLPLGLTIGLALVLILFYFLRKNGIL